MRATRNAVHQVDASFLVYSSQASGDFDGYALLRKVMNCPAVRYWDLIRKERSKLREIAVGD